MWSGDESVVIENSTVLLLDILSSKTTTEPSSPSSKRAPARAKAAAAWAAGWAGDREGGTVDRLDRFAFIERVQNALGADDSMSWSSAFDLFRHAVAGVPGKIAQVSDEDIRETLDLQIRSWRAAGLSDGDLFVAIYDRASWQVVNQKPVTSVAWLGAILPDKLREAVDRVKASAEAANTQPEPDLVQAVAASAWRSPEVDVWRRAVVEAGDNISEACRRLAAVAPIDDLINEIGDAIGDAMPVEKRRCREGLRPWISHKLRKVLLRGGDDRMLINAVALIGTAAAGKGVALTDWKTVSRHLDAALDRIGGPQ